ncbi:3'(2'),5'-bisphosphate nucleotidase CysQ [Hyphococcus flavus]|uniref:3'(2'),5'-bisphosphate nucleotidase CysQ n=1 Tax=Hyphococcus flavus TaxID=1866326 RepID=A0AAE9ZC34_9PROT|nr:3'(2'),5'-bisphosphate nucleotidase CysQ [Hyphococcus flavus]WDI32093.1 3'(2'),5'-bisphosphate nucleotidase CysQ [Hyphococcus flavus]
MTKISPSDEDLAQALSGYALEAGAAALEIYNTEFTADIKEDKSPVTQADRLGEEIILKGLKSFAPSIPILAEESASEGNAPDDLGNLFFLVDPLDGTREFINRTGEFTVNIALIENGRAIYGVVYAPASNIVYAGGREGAWKALVDENGALGKRSTINVRTTPSDGLIAVASRSHRSRETDEYLKTLNVADFTAAGSSLKFCLLAEGKADVYPRFGRTMEWDTGAGQAVLEAAGGSVLTHPHGEPLAYGKSARGYDNPHFIAWGRIPG